MERVLQSIDDAWDCPESTVTEIIKEPLFPFKAPSLAHGHDQLWDRKALPLNEAYPTKLPLPKTDYHVGYRNTLKSEWNVKVELAAADHPLVKPYTQPTGENICPSYLAEVKSEAKGGTLYAAENQLASAGAHCVNAMLWLLDQIEPGRTRSCTDALVFSDALSQREAVASVHWFNPADEQFYMSYIGHFYFVDHVQEYYVHGKNMRDWLADIQGPNVRGVLKELYEVTKTWKKCRPGPASSASLVPDGADSLEGDIGRPKKTQRKI